MHVFACQLDLVWENRPANHAKVLAMLKASTAPRGSLVVLPEMFATGFNPGSATVEPEGPTGTEAFLAEAARAHGVYLMGGVVTPTGDGRVRNEAVAFSPEGRLVVRYAKMHPFSFGGESAHLAAGDSVAMFNWQGCLTAPFVCYDLRFPEVFRATVRLGVQLFVVIANWPTARIEHWITLLRARAIENQAYLVGVNRCGADPKLQYPGRSLVVDPQGVILADAGEQEGVTSAQIDLEKLTSWRREFPVLVDMRADFAPAPPA